MPAVIKILCLCVLMTLPALAQEGIQGDDGLVLFLQTDRAASKTLDILGGVPARMLNDSTDGRQVAVAELAPGWRHQLPAARDHTLEVLALEGELQWQSQTLGTHDHAYLPKTAPAPTLRAGENGARLLVFLDPPRASDGDYWRVTHTRAKSWRPGVVSQRDTGMALDLQVKDLLWVESTGQRTWLVRLGADFEVPWEVHDSAEEGFLLEGDYHLDECLPGGPMRGEYRADGYFYRPGGIAHGGPESGSNNGALWLLRSPRNLTVEFLGACP